ncbi:MAG: HAD-IIB family hydrolase [Nanoarchaeota archaeon]
MITTALILAGGLGTRLRPLTDTTPKPLLPIKGKPILQHALEQLKRQGLTNVILSIGFEWEKIKSYFQDGKEFGVTITYSIETEPLGTGGAVKKALSGLAEPAFVIWGDNLMDIDYKQLYRTYLQHHSLVTMTLTPREDVENFGVAELQANKVLRFVEKPSREKAPSNFINAGAIVLEPSCLSFLPAGKSSIEYDLYERLKPGEITAYIHQGQWFPTDTLEKYSIACMDFIPVINWPAKKVIIADVDQTICEPAQVIEQPLVEEIAKLASRGYAFAFISGTNLEELQRMISAQLGREHHLLANTGATYVVQRNGTAMTVYSQTLTPAEKQEIVVAVEKLIFHYRLLPLTSKEDQLLDRKSQITLSVLGRKAPLEIKKAFDPEGTKREEWVTFLRQYLPEDRYEIRIGGTTSIDITRKGIDKEWGIKEFARFNNFQLSEILFIGDKLYPGGNDYPAAKIVDCLAVRNPEDTLKKLQELAKKNQTNVRSLKIL